MSKNSFEKYLENGEKLINERISNDISEKYPIFSQLPRFGTDLSNRLHNFATRGKGLRGTLIMLSSEMFGYEDKRMPLGIASGLEFIHSSLLIHDDIMDNDLLRRGIPSFFSQYLSLIKKDNIKDDIQTAKSMSICAGDFGFFLGMQIISNSIKNLKESSKIMNLITNEIMLVGIAQMEDVFLGNIEHTPGLEEIELVYLHKTARYSFSLPMVVGVNIAGENLKTIELIEKLGKHLGFIFQLRDDEIGIFSDENISGKTVGSDIRENKKTYIRSMLYSATSKGDQKILNDIFGKRNIAIEEINKIKTLIISTDTLKKVNKIMKEHEVEASKIIESLGINSHYKNILFELLYFISNRKK